MYSHTFDYLNLNILNEAFQQNKLKIEEAFDVEKFIKVNELKEVSDPVFFNGLTPSPKGLLSNEIFGITKAERSGIYAYIELGGDFIQPLPYKTLCSLNSKIEHIVHGTDTFSINAEGDIVQDPNGNTGIDWLKKNFNKIKFKQTESSDRTKKIKYIEKVKDKMWTSKCIVIPAYYRDVDTKQASIGVGEINKLYSALIIASRSLKDSADYGLSLSDATKGRIQETLKQIFDWFGTGTTIAGQETSGNLPGKTGLIKKGIMYKTIDYSVRLVLSAPQLKAESLDDLLVDMDHCGEPLAAVLVNFMPFIVFYLRRFFENEFAGSMTYPIITRDGDIINVPLDDYQIIFSDIEIKKQIDRFVHGYSNRFIPVPVPVKMDEYAKMIKDKKMKPVELFMKFKGREITDVEEYKNNADKEFNPIDRALTWCDLFYMAACEVVKDKMVLITRFPIDCYLNQYPSKIHVKSTIDTESVVINNELYRWYPRIRKEDIGTNTSSMFSDTLSISNGMIDAMGADYDGDTAIVKPIYTVEANEELRKASDSKVNMVGMDGISPRGVSKECVMTLYSLTIHPDKSVKLIDPEF